MSNTPNKITKKFQDQVNSLISEGIVANQQEIVDTLNWNKSQMSQAMKGAKNIPLAVYRKFTDRYKLDNELKEPEAGYNTSQEVLTLLREQNALLKDQLSLAQGEARHIAVMNFAMLKVMRKTMAQVLAKVEKREILEVAGKIDKETAAYYRSVRERGSLIDLDI
jgi:hypothetical protein